MRPGPCTPVRRPGGSDYSGPRCRRFPAGVAGAAPPPAARESVPRSAEAARTTRPRPTRRPGDRGARRYGEREETLMGPLRSVVLAGGGTGGHIYPLLAFADCLRRHDPGVRITCLGTPKGLENELIPPHGLRPAADPGVPAAPVGQHEPDAHPGPDVEGGPRGRQGASTRCAPTWWSASAGTSRCPAYLAAWRRELPIVIHEVNVPPGVANRLGMKFTKNVAVGFPHQPAQAESLRDARVVGVPLRRVHHRAGPGRAAPRRPRPLRAAARPAGAVRLRRLAGRPLDQPGGRRGGQGAGPRRRPGAARDRAPATSRCRCPPTCRCRT